MSIFSPPVQRQRQGGSGSVRGLLGLVSSGFALALAVPALAFVAPALALAAPAAAQTPPRSSDPPLAADDAPLSVEGRVVDGGGQAIPYADVALTGSPRSVRADADGRFRFTGFKAGPVTILVSAHGYGAAEVEIDAGPEGAPLVIALVRDPVALDAITVTGTMKAASVSASAV